MKNDIESFSNEIFQQLMVTLDAVIDDHSDELVRALKSMNAIREAMEKLRSFIIDQPFNTQPDEIKFFKETKPRFLSRFLYHEQIFSLRLNEPFGDTTQVLEYYKMELGNIERYFKDHRQFYSYCISGSTELDTLYFIRNGQSPLINIDRSFSTGFDYIVSKIISCQMVKSYIKAYLLQPSAKKDIPKSKLTWTGPKTALVELIYSLHTVEAINNGKADVCQIAELFEEVFNVRLGNYYRVLQDIRLRKGHQSTFLDELREKFIQRLDNISQ